MGSPVKLSLALNYSVFQSECLKNIPEAIRIAEKALGDAQDKIEELPEEEFKEAKGIINLLNENVQHW